MAFLRDDHHEPAIRMSAAVVVLIAAMVALHLARVWYVTGAADAAILNDYGLVPRHYLPGAATGLLQRIVPFVSYGFLYLNATHLILTCLWLAAFGSVVARRWGGAFFLIFFFLCGAVAAGCHLAANWGGPGIAIGAWAATAGCAAAAIRMMGIEPSAETGPLVPILSTQVLAFTAVWLGWRLWFGYHEPDIAGPRDLAWQAYFGGYFAGLLLSSIFDRIAGPTLETGPENPSL